MKRKLFATVAIVLIMTLVLTTGLSALPAALLGDGSLPGGLWIESAYAETVVEKYFYEMTQDEKDRVLADLITQGEVPNTITVKGKKYSLNISNWNNLGVISYGIVSIVNGENQNTSHPNYKDGCWRYLGYDMYGGLYGNDNFPPDYPSSTPPENKNWMAVTQVKANGAARNLIGESTVEKDQDFSNAEKRYTANLFLSKNPGWRAKGKDENFIIEHFFFNAVIKENGLTQGQFVGVHNLGGGVIRYQTFSVEARMKFVIPPEPKPPETEEPDEPAVLPPEPDVGVNCELWLPPETYVGHPTLAEDWSVFNLEGEVYSAARAYDEGLASNSFRLPGGGGRFSKISTTKAEVTFDNPGNYNVQLTVNTLGGNSGTDIKPILVKPTPTIIHSLTGTQKQNRKQVLNIRVAKRPATILTDFWVRLEYLDKGESVILHHKETGGNTLSNSESIKTRPIERLDSSNMYFEECKLEFLLKNTENANCRYTIYVEDSRGDWDKVDAEFTVVPDRPPQAEIFLEGAYVREANSDFAKIVAEDISTGDGDQIERSWFYRPTGVAAWLPLNQASPGFEDQSFGIGKKIAFQKENVGKFQVKLFAKDYWTEETLPEYVSEADRLSSEATAFSEVINIAPIVGLEALKLKTANITILTGGEAEEATAKKNKGRLEAELLQEGIDANIQVIRMYPEATEEKRAGARATMQLSKPFGFQGAWLFYESNNYIVDDNCLYRIDASWPGTSLDEYPVSPCTISCWQHSGEQIWSFSFTESIMPVPNVRSGPYFAQDDMGKYLFFVSDGKSLMLSKDNGTLLTVLDYPVGTNVYVGGDNIYTVKTDGIYSISTFSGKQSLVFKGNILGGKTDRIDGLIHFVVKIGTKFHRGLFNPENGKTTLEELFLVDPVYGSSSHSVLALDTDGKIVINTNTTTVYTSGGSTGNVNNYACRIHVYGRDNRLIYQSPIKSDDSSGQFFAFPVFDEGGRCNYIAHSWRSRSGTNRYVYVQIYRVNDGYSQTGNVRNTNSEYPTVFNKILYAREIDGIVHIATGAEWIYVWNAGYGIYEERARAFTFDPGKNSVRVGNHYNEMGLGLSTFENGCSSQVLAAVQAGYNQPGNSYAYMTVVKWDQSIEDILRRNVDRHFAGGKSLNALVIYDESNDADYYNEEILAMLEVKAKDQSGILIMAKDADVEGDGLLYEILGRSEGGRTLLSVEVPPGLEGQMSKIYDLSANERYYFEYEYFGDVSLDFLHESRATQGADFSAEKYRIKQSHYEDFSDPTRTDLFYDLNPAAVGGGYYQGAYCQTRKSEKNHFVASSSELHFTVPPGELAFLSFDYLLQKDSGTSNWMQSYVAVDGQFWANYTPSGGIGHYSHPYLLGEGKHTLTFVARQYGSRQEEARMWLRSLCVDLLEETENINDTEAAVLEGLSLEELENGYKRVRGSFRTPPVTAAYGRLENVIVSEGSPGTTPYTVVTNTNEDRRAFRVNVPAGHTAIITRVPTSSRSVWNDYNVTYKSGSDTWTYMPKLPYPESSMYTWPSNGIITTGLYTGAKDFSLSASSYRSTYGNFGAVTLVMTESTNAAWKNLNHFLTGSGGDKKFFLQTGTYQGSRLIFNFSEGSHRLRNLKVYHIRDGAEVINERQALANSARLSEWDLANAEAALVDESLLDDGEKDEHSLVYKKGEKIMYGINYFDYEGDPSKKQYWKYTHEPFNDGLHPSAGAILHEPVDRFYIDGKYTVEHWQEDNTSRPLVAEGNPDYDKLSNVVNLTFYIEGGAFGPWIESIKTIPVPVKEGDVYRMEIKVDDVEKDVLRLRTELYKEGELIFAHEKTGIEADSWGRYPAVLTDLVPESAMAGSYEVICVVRDEGGAGLGKHRFTVVSEGRVTGMVNHTVQWDTNRKLYNRSFFKEEVNRVIPFDEYMAMSVPRKRGTNVFWSGERFMLEAFVAGSPLKVMAEIVGYPAYKVELAKTGGKNLTGEWIYKGELWDKAMLNKWGKGAPVELTFKFTAEYGGGAVKRDEAKVIIDSNTDYWLLHRVY